MTLPTDNSDLPAFAATVESILNRYRGKAVEKANAVRALTAVTLALAPESLFQEDEIPHLDAWFEDRLDAVRDGQDIKDATREAVGLMSAAAEGNREAVRRLSKI
ncbi:hypothetical protein [Asticcacaulis solisilvae]|uniref:hypothetical protein n=1 Tax=Asticcacaulis solisilvae TaxID=1217274 RepID=UPI003FD8F85A